MNVFAGMNRYYVYSYLREDGSPYYIGKGTGRRMWRDGGRKGVAPPKDRDRVKVIKDNLSETDAYELEELLILMWGRKIDGSGILRNVSMGGEMPPVCRGHNEETKRKIRESNIRTKSKGVSEETRKRMSEAAKRRAQTPEGISQLTKNGYSTAGNAKRDGNGRFVK